MLMVADGGDCSALHSSKLSLTLCFVLCICYARVSFHALTGEMRKKGKKGWFTNGLSLQSLLSVTCTCRTFVEIVVWNVASCFVVSAQPATLLLCCSTVSAGA